MAQKAVQSALLDIWAEGDAWLVGEYILMPDHLHLFCAPRNTAYTLKQWVTWWKRKLSCQHLPDTDEWQRDFWDTRLRTGDNYTEKWHYVRENPVRKNLVKSADEWPFQGQVNVLPWTER